MGAWEQVWRLAGAACVDPLPLTLRELLAVAEGKGRHDWNQTSLLVATILNAAPKGKKTKLVDPVQVNPYEQRDKARTRGIDHGEVTADMAGRLLREAMKERERRKKENSTTNRTNHTN